MFLSTRTKFINLYNIEPVHDQCRHVHGTNINLKNQPYQIIVPRDQATSESQYFTWIFSVTKIHKTFALTANCWIIKIQEY